MPRIQVLDKQVAELIAAGEVVDRPSSVIKELVENAVDAGATIITVEIRRGGVTFMRVTDNGCGIAPEEVPTAFLRHATSKVVQQDDLNSIATLGFRGEALASISAVAHVEMLTRVPGAVAGVRYVGGGSEDYTLEEAGCPEGTTILVRDLFYNTPARMKFLKKDSTEGNSVAGILDKLALSHPEISFRFIRDGKEQLHTPGDGKLSSTIYAVYGREFSSTLIPVKYELGHVRVEGCISAPTSSRPNRSMQNFFINGRYIRSRTAMAALEEAYKGSIMVGKFPACVLHLHLSFGAVDVNVHPAKLEVRFVNERPIFDAVYHGVKSALHAGDKPKVMELKRPPVNPYAPVLEKKEQLRLEPQPPAQRPVQRSAPVPAPQKNQPLPERGVFLRDSGGQPERTPAFSGFLEQVLDREPHPVAPPSPQAPLAERPPLGQAEEAAAAPSPADLPLPAEEPAPREIPAPPVREFHSRIIGEAFGTYLIVEYSKEELMFIDKHAAHERLLYERLKRENAGGEAQALLEPVTVTLDKEEYTAVLNHLEAFSQAGFEVEDFGTGTVLVRSAPLLLDGGDAAGAVMEIAGYLASLKDRMTTEHQDWVYHNVACRAAMKAGDSITREEMVSLAQELERNPDVRYCPHGRPVYILLRRRDIERQFGRV
ncbi:MAG: DNA mismatch repair endonuclease MutL [Acutalibacter sp.]